MKAAVISIGVLALAGLLFFTILRNGTTWKSDAVVQRTNDAYVTANQLAVSTRISGTVRRVDVEDYQPVKKGQLLLELDDVDYEGMANESAAAITAAKAGLAANQVAKRADDASVAGARQAVAAAQAAAMAAQDAADGAQAQVTQSATEYHRQEALLAAKAATHQQYEQALEARDTAKAQLDARNADLLRAQASIAMSKASLDGAVQKRAGLDVDDASLRAQIVAKTAALAVSDVNLGYTKIYAPADGRIGKLEVHQGQLLSAGEQVTGFVQDGSWVEANYQETQLAHVRTGDMAEIRIDAFPGKTFKAWVAQIAPASGAASALLPPDNATGNFTKVVQRIPVKLLFEDNAAAAVLQPGLSVEVAIHTDRVERGQEQAKARP